VLSNISWHSKRIKGPELRRPDEKEIELGAKVVNVALYSVQPVLAAGFEAVIGTLDSFAVSRLCTDVTELMDHVNTARPELVLVEVTSDVTLSALKQLAAIAGRAPIILWVDAVSTEFASQALSAGIRGILRTTLPIDLQLKCLQKVAAGELWLEKPMTDRLLCSERVNLTGRERQLLVHVSQGQKNKEMAHQLGITEGTVKVYLSRLFQKVGVKDRFELALFALKNLGPHQSSGSTPSLSVATSPEESRPTSSFLPVFLSLERPRVGLR
jgi:two-component system nitrate/nitrite response regulator NarL